MVPQIVVGAAIVRRGMLLGARRSAPATLAGGWELPGGKVEPGESELAALVRECREELGIEITPGARVPGEWPLGPSLVLRVYLAEIVTGEPAPLEDHDELRWLGAADLFAVPWLPADVPAVTAVSALANLA
ncbi:(deoxy)nucleoside triphosphate pyrophosphohydrolase [Sporichthya brevicatena]|uniref:(deoxy)nucleoside triphosphate pyrophosphohydrolase n=1 Tax=Sporichthya brevicatena TaxID=171442 RepID=UPI0031DCE792